MALNFPDPAAQTPVNTWSPTSTPSASTNGLTYAWDGEKWSTAAAAFEDIYVSKEGDVMTGNLTVPSLNGGPLAGFRNQLRNPFFAVFQRTSPVTVGTNYSSTFGADGWTVRGTSSTGGSTELTAGFPGSNIMRTYLSQENASHTDFFYLRQKIESVTTLAGQTATLTLQLRTGVTFSLNPQLQQVFGTGGSSVVTVNSSEGAQEAATGGIRTLTWTFNVPSIDGKSVNTTDDCLVLLINSTAAVNGTIEWIAAQLEPGPVATPFEQRPISQELAMCQRYYQTFDIRMTIPASLATATNGQKYFWQQYVRPVHMRATPTTTLPNGDNVGGVNNYQSFNAQNGIQMGYSNFYYSTLKLDNPPGGTYSVSVRDNAEL